MRSADADLEAELRRADHPDPTGIGPQHANDEPFVRRMRRHQSWWRAKVLGLPCGTGPTSGSTTLLGSMLRPEDGRLGRNFLTPEIHQVANRRMAAGHGVEPFRCANNLLSSQPMCFNLFAPLVCDNELATRLLRALLPEEVRRVRNVEIEYRPVAATELLGDRTSFDAFISYERTTGESAFLGAEVKLTERFSQHCYMRPSYRELTLDPRSPFRTAALGQLADRRWNQLWRNHLLVEAHRRPPAPHGAIGRLVLVRHPLDASCARDAASYCALLEDPSTFLDWPLELIVDAWRSATDDSQTLAWLDALADRYLNLDLSGS